MRLEAAAETLLALATDPRNAVRTAAEAALSELGDA
jgi:hypothetical protein